MTNIKTAQTLTITAFEILIEDLERHKNKPGELQRAALWELLDTLSAYAFGTERGRQAFGLATGAGKTSAVVAFITAIHRLGMDNVALAVAASKVAALCGLKEKLLANGVPEELIGLKHSHGASASLPSTGNDDRRFQLVTHARVRGGSDKDLFIQHRGKKRAVMVFDETLFRSDTFAVTGYDFEHALAGFRVLAKHSGTRYDALLAYMTECGDLVEAGLTDAKQSQIHEKQVVTINLPQLDQANLDGYTAQLASLPSQKYEALQSLLQMSQDPLRIILTQQRDGVIWFKVSVPEELEDVVILDASHPIRDLISLDPTIRTAGHFLDMDVKRFDNVTIHQMLSPGGRHSITKSFNQIRKENRTVSKEIIEVVKANADAKGILLFTFKKHDIDIEQRLVSDLADAGIDLDELTPEGRKRVNLLCWGDETSLNGLEHCDVVIMAGVLHRCRLDLAATIVGQADDLGAKVDNTLTTRMLNSEIAHLIYQGASRGSCRTINDGQALPMKLYLIHRELVVRPILDKVMKGVKWALWQPEHDPSGSSGVTDLLCLRINAYLESLLPEVTSISTRKLKEGMTLQKEGIVPQTFTNAIRRVDAISGLWRLEGRTMVSVDSTFKKT